MPFCPHCGAKNIDDARFCHSCGAAIPVVPAGAPAQPPPAQPPVIQPPPPAVVQAPMVPPVAGQPPVVGYPPQYLPQMGVPQPQVGWGPTPAPAAVVKRKSPVGAALLGFFLGAFGAQAFYNGQAKKGIVQLVGFWIIWLFLLPWPQYYGDTSPTGIRFLAGLIFAAACAFDGYKVAERRNSGQPVSEWGTFS